MKPITAHGWNRLVRAVGRALGVVIVAGLALAAGRLVDAAAADRQPPGPETPEPPVAWYDPPVEPVVRLPAEAAASVHFAAAPELPLDCAELAPPGGAPPEACVYGFVVLDDVPQTGVALTLSSAAGQVEVVTAPGPASTQPYFVAALSWAPLAAEAGEIVSAQAALGGEVNATHFLAAAGMQQVDLWYASTCGPTYVGGVIAADTTWQRACSPYIVTDNVLVYAGVTLAIMPGTTVLFDTDTSLRVDGELLALGDDLALLRFAGHDAAAPGAWAHLLFGPTSVDAVFDLDGNYLGGTILVYALVDQAGGTTAADKAAIRIDGSAPFLTHAFIRHSGGDGVRAYNGGVINFTGGAVTDSAKWGVYNAGATEQVVVATSEIARNADGGIYSTGNTTAWVLANRLRDNPKNYAVQVLYGFGEIGLNWIEGNAGGIYFNAGANVAQNVILGSTTNGGLRRVGGTAIINLNVIYANANPTGYGGGIYLQSGTGDVNHNVLAGNQARFGGGLAITSGTANVRSNALLGNGATDQGGGLYHSTSSGTTVSLQHNTILNNQAGSGQGGVYLTKFPDFSQNNLHGNTPYDLFNGNLIGTSSLLAEYNWWGSAEPGVILAHIWDYLDDSSLSLVDFDPWYTGPLVVDAPLSPPVGLAASAAGASLQLSWNANPESDTKGYLVYYDTDAAGFPYAGQGALEGASPIDAGAQLTYTLTGLPDGVYHVSVTAYDFGANGAYDQPEGHESWFAAEQVRVLGDPPGAFGKLQPLPGASGQPLNLTLSWGPSSGVEHYAYCYDTSNDGACATWVNNGLATSAGLAGLAPGTTFYWHARAVNASGVTYADGASASWSFTTGSLPGAFSKNSPTNGATNRPLDQRLAWAPSSGAEHYEYCYDTSNDNTCGSWINIGSADQVTLSGLSPGMTYYWQARAVNGFGMTYANGTSTAFWSFTTGALPGAFGKSSPADGATGQPLTLTLRWTASAGASSYEYCHDTTEDDACAAWSSTGGAASVALSGLLPGTTYHWHVRALNAFGVTYAEGSATAFWQFSTEGLRPIFIPIAVR